jgi:hypothetical protein
MKRPLCTLSGLTRSRARLKILGVFRGETFIELLGEGCVDHNRCDVNASGAHPIIFIFHFGETISGVSIQ